MKYRSSPIAYSLLPVAFLLLASFFRLTGVNWDQHQHLHPDERFLTMVTEGVMWPETIEGYFDTQTSPLNPHNRGYGFFVYGTFPVFLTKWVAELLGQANYTDITLIGRQLSVLFDLGTVILVFLIAKTTASTGKIRHTSFPLLSMLLYGVAVLPIQLSHFYAVDTYLTFFLTLCLFSFFNILTRIKTSVVLDTPFLIWTLLAGIGLGFAIGSKVTAILLVPVLGIGLLFLLWETRRFSLVFCIAGILFVTTYLTLRIAQPYLFASGDFFSLTLNPLVVDNWRQLQALADPSGGFPPAVQWITTLPYLFPLNNLLFWGFGLPAGLIVLSGLLYQLIQLCFFVKRCVFLRFTKWHSEVSILNFELFLLTLWCIILFAHQGAQFAKALRYIYPIYPALSILGGYVLSNILLFINKRYPSFFARLPASRGEPARQVLCYLFFVLLLLVYPFSFISIYTRPHTRVAASEWIYKNVPSGSVKSDEHWDDALPLSLGTNIHEVYTGLEFPMYGPDTQEKWRDMDIRLRKVDHIILTSNRQFGALTSVPHLRPITTKYYQMLFDGTLGFEKVAEFTSRPNLPLPFISVCLTPPFTWYGSVSKISQECNLSGISFVDDYADETFTVYDHPKVVIFKKVRAVDYFTLLWEPTSSP